MCEITCTEKSTVGQLVRYFRGSKGGVGGGLGRRLGGKMILLGAARVLAVEQPTEVESQVAAVVWLAHGGSLIRAAPEHLVNCSSMDTSLPIQILRYLMLHGFGTCEI